MKNKEHFDLNNLTIKEVMSPAEAYAKVKELQESGLADDNKAHPSLDECLMNIIRKGEVSSHMTSFVRKRYDELKKEYMMQQEVGLL